MVAAELQTAGGQQLLGVGIFERSPLELEEQKHRLDCRGALLNPLQQRPAGGIGGVCRELQRRIGSGASDQLVDPLELVHRRLERGRVQLGDLAGVRRSERLGQRGRLVEQAVDAALGASIEQRRKVPFGLEQLRIGHLVGVGRHRFRG